VTTAEAARLHDRIDQLDAEIGRRHDELSERLGAIEQAVVRLQTVQGIAGRGFWVMAVAAATLISSVVAACVTAAIL